MANDLLFGIQTNGIKHADADPMADVRTRFRMVKEAGSSTTSTRPRTRIRSRTSRPARRRPVCRSAAGGWFYELGGDEGLLERNVKLGAELGSLVHNTQIKLRHADGHVVTDDEVMAAYLAAAELGEKYGCVPCFEVHVNMWSEDFPGSPRSPGWSRPEASSST